MCYTEEMPDFAALSGDALLSALEQESVKLGVSDIHASPEKNHVRVELRLHGVLEHCCDISHATYEQFVRRVKFASKLKLNITTMPQDGQYTFATDAAGGQRIVNVRVATLPSRFGESLTLRLLDPLRGIVELTALGFPTAMQETLAGIVRMPYGLFLVTGPTGSGKTTTLYALLKNVIGTKRHVVTLEDPVEYEIAGIVQSEIDADRGFTFASGLRSVLRHDPNVILVGEIRDLETAQTAVDASLTGHLVLSTLHTNSAIEAIPRLLSMGVSPYTFAPALRGVLAQRLVRVLSPNCRVPGVTCDPVDPKTYSGRTVIPELLLVSPAVRSLVLRQAEAEEIRGQAEKEGFIAMRTFGEDLVKRGITMREELQRVTI